MTQEEKQLLLKDLCARLPYGVKVMHSNTRIPKEILNIDSNGIITVIRKIEYNGSDIVFNPCGVEKIKPYLRSMSSMTEKEYKELEKVYNNGESYHVVLPQNDEKHHATLCKISNGTIDDWLNQHYFDYRGLIEKGLALEAPEGMYKTE